MPENDEKEDQNNNVKLYMSHGAVSLVASLISFALFTGTYREKIDTQAIAIAQLQASTQMLNASINVLAVQTAELRKDIQYLTEKRR